MKQLDLFPFVLTDAELKKLNLLIQEICEQCYPHDEFFEVEPGIFFEV